jgi:hypothetical protein
MPFRTSRLATLAAVVVGVPTGQTVEFSTPAYIPTEHPVGDAVPYTVCADGYGWVRPSVDDQRRYLKSLGEEYQQLARYTPPFSGLRFAAIVGDPERERYALATSGLWAATPNTDQCDRTGELSLLMDRQVIEILTAQPSGSHHVRRPATTSSLSTQFPQPIMRSVTSSTMRMGRGSTPAAFSAVRPRSISRPRPATAAARTAR